MPVPFAGPEKILYRVADSFEEIEPDPIQEVLFKTVDLFSGILKRRLVLRDGEVPYTDGCVIAIPFSRPDRYHVLERALAHLLFETNIRACAVFVEKLLGGLQYI